MELLEQPAVIRLQQFIQAMNGWELKFYPLLSTHGKPYHAQASEELRPIFEKYVIETDKNFTRIHAPAVGDPPEYDLEQSTIDRIEGKKKIVIYVQTHNRVKSLYRYNLVDENDEYMLIKRERFSSFQDRWTTIHF